MDRRTALNSMPDGEISKKPLDAPHKGTSGFFAFSDCFYINLRNRSFRSSTLASFGLPGAQASA